MIRNKQVLYFAKPLVRVSLLHVSKYYKNDAKEIFPQVSLSIDSEDPSLDSSDILAPLMSSLVLSRLSSLLSLLCHLRSFLSSSVIIIVAATAVMSFA